MMSLRSSAVHLVLLAPLLPSFVQSLPLSATANSRSERLVVFGDSFSDNGNGAWIASNGTWPPSFYYQHQFSNGPVWPTLVAKHTGLQLIDLAAGGATANNSFIAGFTGFNSTVPVPSSQDQIDQYQADYTISRGDIYVDFIGANDAFFSTNVTGTQIAQLIDGQLADLYKRGARRFLLSSYPDLSALPFAATSSLDYNTFLTDYSTSLRTGLYGLQEKYTAKGAHIEVADVYGLFQRILADPAKYGFTDPALVQVACAQGVYPSEGVELSICPVEEQDKHLFWDVYHPSRSGHALVAKEMEKALKRLGSSK